VVCSSVHAVAKDQQCQEKSITYSNRISRKKRLDNSSPVTSCDGANNNNNNREFRQPPWFRLTKSSSQGADVTNRPVQNSKTACVILICFFFNCFFFQQVSKQFGWAAREWPEFGTLFLKSVLSEYGKIWSGALLSTVLWVLTPVLRNKTKRGKIWAKLEKQRGCHDFYWWGVFLLHRIVSTKPFLIALTLIHKLQDILTFVLFIAILCCFNPFRSNYG